MTTSDVTGRTDTDRSRFLATMSHDIRTPLTAMRGALGLMGREDLPPHVMGQMIKMMGRASSRLERLTFALLTMDQIKEGSVPLLREICDLRELVQDAVKITSREHELIDVRYPSGRVEIVCDRERTLQALDHVLDNARKYGGGDGTISIAVWASGDRGRVSIADDGPGVAPEERQRIFEPYVQAAERLLDEPRGTGVGLYIARWNAQAMRGSLELMNDGPQAVFELSLPLLSSNN